MNKTITLAVAATCALCAGSTFAAEYALGAGIHMSASEYKGVDIEVVPAPIMNAETEYFYLHGLEAGGYLVTSPLIEMRGFLLHSEFGIRVSPNTSPAPQA